MRYNAGADVARPPTDTESALPSSRSCGRPRRGGGGTSAAGGDGPAQTATRIRRDQSRRRCGSCCPSGRADLAGPAGSVEKIAGFASVTTSRGCVRPRVVTIRGFDG